MALVTPTVTDLDGYGYAKKAVWVLTTADTTGVAVGLDFFLLPDKTWHAYASSWGSTAVAAVQGSNDDTDGHYGALKSVAGGGAISWNADAGSPMTQIEDPLYVRPKLTTAGTGATVTVICVARRDQKRRS